LNSLLIGWLNCLRSAVVQRVIKTALRATHRHCRTDPRKPRKAIPPSYSTVDLVAQHLRVWQAVIVKIEDEVLIAAMADRGITIAYFKTPGVPRLTRKVVIRFWGLRGVSSTLVATKTMYR
jgi:hypothetical protein